MENNGESITREAFLDADDRPLVAVPLDEELYGPDARIYVRVFDGHERSALEANWADKETKKNPGGLRWDVLHRTLCDERGRPLFAPEDHQELMGKNAGTLETLFEKACDLNGLRKKDVEELEKNSDDGQ